MYQWVVCVSQGKRKQHEVGRTEGGGRIKGEEGRGRGRKRERQKEREGVGETEEERAIYGG